MRLNLNRIAQDVASARDAIRGHAEKNPTKENWRAAELLRDAAAAVATADAIIGTYIWDRRQ